MTRAGLLLATHGLLPAFAHTSLHYGALQGRRKDQVRREYGEHQFTAWRRSYDATPPPLGTAAARL
jgi:2,3-bisphosphoglycerate-dependent phosphoglycerate mutase